MTRDQKTVDLDIPHSAAERAERVAFVRYIVSATKEVEIVIGADRVLRLNVDGICVTRFRIEPECAFQIRNDLQQRIEIA